jgi:UDP-2,3-diacylglucosamine pyrophosphatase LpxH
MIVLVSDLHLQHTSKDAIRWRDGEHLIECGVKRNVSAGALNLLLAEVAENVARCEVRQVELVLAGDIFELHRTPAWFLGGRGLRPFTSAAQAPAELEGQVRDILEAVVDDNQGFFETLASSLRTGTYSYQGSVRIPIGAPVRVHYLPGNHDRLANGWPQLRARVRELLCIPGEPTAPFPHVLDWSERYGVKIRHGHEYEPSNFGGQFVPGSEPSAADYAAPALGDYATIDMVMRLAVSFRAHYAKELRTPGPPGDLYRNLYLSLTEFDDVRPATALPGYLAAAVGSVGPLGFRVLRPILRGAFESARSDPFFLAQARPLGVAKYFEGAFGELFDQAIRNLSPEWLPKLLAAMAKEPDAKNAPAEWAAQEAGLADGSVQVMIAGHTHKPDHVALPAAGEAAFFIDSGTWRTRIDEGVGGAFGRLRAYTMVFCYQESERHAGEQRRFETWTGHLKGDTYGPYSTLLAPAPAEPATIVFTELLVEQVDEGKTANGAELAFHFGVDDQALSLLQDGVHDGDRLTLDPERYRVIADGALDGELWCWGLERDRGDSLLDRDDPLPWAVDFLPRTAGSRSFLRGTSGELCARSVRGMSLRLVYQVS